MRAPAPEAVSHRPSPGPAAAPVPPPVRRHNASSAPPEPAAAPADTGVVLLVGGRTAGRREGVQALERAGFGVLDAADGTAAIQLLRQHGDAVHVAVIAGESGAEPEDIARDLDALAHGLRMVLVREEGADQVPPADLLDATVLREPVHPLTLVQTVREARSRR
jgi:hypothetical protein